MKQLAKSLIVASALVGAGSAVADYFGDINPYIGADLQLTKMKARAPFDSILAKSFPGANLYVGTKFHENFGVEAGYNWSKTKDRTADIAARFDGVAAANFGSGAKPGAKTTLRRNSAFFDVVGFMPVMDCVELIGSVGYGYVMPKLSITTAGGTAVTGYELKNQSVLRLGLGASYMVTDMVGLKAKLGWENTKHTHFKNSDDRKKLRANGGALTTRPLKDSTTLNVGAFVKF